MRMADSAYKYKRIQNYGAICHLARKTTDAHLWKWCVLHKSWRTSASDQPAKLSGSFGVGVMWERCRCVLSVSSYFFANRTPMKLSSL